MTIPHMRRMAKCRSMARHPGPMAAASRATCCQVRRSCHPGRMHTCAVLHCSRRRCRCSCMQICRATARACAHARTHTHRSPLHTTPGAMFVIWSSYWLFSILRLHVIQQRKPARPGGSAAVSRPWYPFPYCKNVPLEPVLKLALTVVGIFVEVSPLGHGEWRCAYCIRAPGGPALLSACRAAAGPLCMQSPTQLPAAARNSSIAVCTELLCAAYNACCLQPCSSSSTCC